MYQKSLFEIAEFKKDGRIARVLYVRDGGYEVCKIDPNKFSGYRISQYSTKEKAVVAAKLFVTKAVSWTKGRIEQVKNMTEYQILHEQRLKQGM